MIVYIKRLWSWLWEGKYLFLFILLVLFIFQLDNLNIGNNTIQNIRYTGLVLQLLGTLTILISLKDKLDLFNSHGLLKFIWNYILSFPCKYVPKTYNLDVDFTTHSSITSRVRVKQKPKEDFKSLLEYIDEEVENINQELGYLKSEFEKKTSKLEMKIDNINMILGSEIKGTKDLIKNSAVSNIWLEIFGFFCVFIGLILGTAPEIVKLII